MEVLAATVSGFAILVLLLAWRLNQEEPLRLESLTPYLETALQPADGAYAVRIGGTRLTWAGWERTFDLRADDVRVVDPTNNRVVAVVPEISITLSVRALLLHGTVAPTAIEVFRPHLTILRELDGEFRILQDDQQNASSIETSTAPILPDFFERLDKAADKDQPTAYLDRIAIIDGALNIIDRRTGINWSVPDADISVRRTDAGLQGNLMMAIERLGAPARLNAGITFDEATGSILLNGTFSDVEAGPLALIDPRLALLRGFVMNFNGSIITSITADGRIGDSRLELVGGAGTAMLLGELDAPLKISQARFVGTLNSDDDRLTLDEATLVLDGPVLKAKGTLTAAQEGLMLQDQPGFGPDMKLSLHVQGSNIPVAPLHRYWPKNAGKNAREWVTENMTAGVVETLEADIALDVPGADWNRAEISNFLGSMTAKDLTIHYLSPMPPIESASGVATFTEKEFTVDFGGGTLQGLTITGGKLVINDFDKPVQMIDMHAQVTGTLPATLTLLDHPRLGYISKLGIDPKASKGDVVAELGFRFPAEKDITFDQVELSANGDITGAAIGKALLDKDFTDGNLKLKLNQNSMNLAGKGNFAGIPIDLEWQENFIGGKFIRRITTKGTTSSEQRRALGFDYSPYVDGPVSSDIVYTVLPKKHETIAAKLDLAESSMAVDTVHWRKEPGMPGAASFEVDLLDGHLAAIRDIALAAGDLVIDGSAKFTAETGEPARLEFSRVNIGRSRLRDVTADFSPGYPDIVIGGGEFDAESLLGGDKEKDKEDEPTPAFALRADRLDKIFLKEKRELKDVSVQMRHDAEWWDLIDMKAIVPAGGAVTLHYGPSEGARHILHVDSADAGAFLAALGISQSVRGGSLLINAEAHDNEPHRPLKGGVLIKDFRMVDAPVLARLLTMATITGFVDLMSGDGFQFDKFKMQFTKTEGRLDIDLAKATGPSIGLTGAGYVDFDKNYLDIAGTVIPVNAVNSVLSDIPVLGDILIGDGMFAVTYGAEGDLGNPEISVNPLSAIAPGFIKGLFDYSTGDEEPPPIQALPPNAKNQK
ncbi:MAG TPA: AsmA-like C-terminal domain-containing protein [Verrucomicrobiae bacterium]|nr:AsmA-like C-terminal domain-containing protein [Verrucomicrobiae bacterium]